MPVEYCDMCGLRPVYEPFEHSGLCLACWIELHGGPDSL